jgi:hypothetical protein
MTWALAVAGNVSIVVVAVGHYWLELGDDVLVVGR